MTQFPIQSLLSSGITLYIYVGLVKVKMGLTTPAGRKLAGTAPPRKGSAMQRLLTATTPTTTEAGLSPDVRRLVASSIAPKYPVKPMKQR